MLRLRLRSNKLPRPLNKLLRPLKALMVFQQYRMRAEEAGAHADALGGELPGNAQHFALAGEIKAVAGFDLYGGDAFSEHRLQPLAALRVERGFVGRARRGDGGADAAA